MYDGGPEWRPSPIIERGSAPAIVRNPMYDSGRMHPERDSQSQMQKGELAQYRSNELAWAKSKGQMRGELWREYPRNSPRGYEGPLSLQDGDRGRLHPFADDEGRLLHGSPPPGLDLRRGEQDHAYEVRYRVANAIPVTPADYRPPGLQKRTLKFQSLRL